MLGKFVKIYARMNPRRQPEERLPLRMSVLACVLIAEITILAMGYYGNLDLLLVPVLTVAGFMFSWRQRHSHNTTVKIVLSLLVVATAWLFFRELSSSLYDTRLPLIKLLLWLQVLHSFDMPSSKDLKFSLASGVTLIAAGAVLSTGMVFAAGLLLFSAAAVVALCYFYLSEEGDRLDRRLTVKPRTVGGLAAVTWLAALCVAIPLLLLLPQNLQAHLYAMPFSSLQRFLGDFSGEVINPNYQTGGNPFDHPPSFDPDSYFGFNPYMDLRSRGQLSEDIVLKVRASGYNFYRGMVFDHYNGKGWEISEELMDNYKSDAPPIDLNAPNYIVPTIHTEVDSFYVERDLPNIIFAAWQPVSLFFPANQVKMDQFQSLRSPYQLTEGTVYSVVSEVPAYDPDQLRRFPSGKNIEAAQEYYQLPADPDDGFVRVRELAQQITAPYENRYDKTMAIERYLKDNYSYDLDIPPLQDEMDATEYFLFEQHAGYCEHFATAMAVMARSAGIPARVVTGYTGGSYNPFTAMWEIGQTDAHAWVEINFGSAGWVAFDPTPGFDYPETGSSHGSWMIGRIASYLESALGDGPLGSIASAAGDATGSAVSFFRSLPMMLILAIITVVALIVFFGRRGFLYPIQDWRQRQQLSQNLGDDYRRQPVLVDYLKVALMLQQLGLRRRPDETVCAFSRRVSRFLGGAEFAELSLILERRRYGERFLESDGNQARSLAASVVEKINGRQSAEKAT